MARGCHRREAQRVGPLNSAYGLWPAGGTPSTTSHVGMGEEEPSEPSGPVTRVLPQETEYGQVGVALRNQSLSLRCLPRTPFFFFLFGEVFVVVVAVVFYFLFFCYRARALALPCALGGSLFCGHKAPLILCSAPSHVTWWAGRGSLRPGSRRSCWATEAAPSCVGDMADTPRDAGLKQAPAPRNEKAPVDFGYVGIDSILEQMRRKAMKQGFEFNIMVVGQSGLGKSTLINTLFKSKISRKSVQPTSEERIPKTIEIKSITHDIEEKGVRMKLTVIDTPGFGDHINNENCWQPIMKFIDDQYEKYLQEEVNINRKKRIPDTRVHCCLYFIPATGHSLRPLDIEFMKRLSKVVNIVPVIAKADTLTLEERVYFKQRITADLLSNGIDVYPQKEFDEDSEDRLVNDKFREMIPFAVVGSDHEYQVNGKRILGRKTKWGTIEVENTTHCEFAYLRDLLIRTHMQNIKDITSTIHFEAYRVKRLNEGNSAMSNGMVEKEPEAQEM